MKTYKELLENSLYDNDARKAEIVADEELVATILVYQFFGFLALYETANDSQKSRIMAHIKKDKRLRLNNIGDDNLDISLSIKLAYDAGLFRNVAIVNEITRFLVKFKSGQIKSIDSGIIADWIKRGLRPNFIQKISDPKIKQIWKAFLKDNDLPTLAVELKKASFKVKDIRGEFWLLARRIGKLSVPTDIDADEVDLQTDTPDIVTDVEDNTQDVKPEPTLDFNKILDEHYKDVLGSNLINIISQRESGILGNYAYEIMRGNDSEAKKILNSIYSDVNNTVDLKYGENVVERAINTVHESISPHIKIIGDFINLEFGNILGSGKTPNDFSNEVIRDIINTGYINTSKVPAGTIVSAMLIDGSIQRQKDLSDVKRYIWQNLTYNELLFDTYKFVNYSGYIGKIETTSKLEELLSELKKIYDLGFNGREEYIKIIAKRLFSTNNIMGTVDVRSDAMSNLLVVAADMLSRVNDFDYMFNYDYKFTGRVSQIMINGPDKLSRDFFGVNIIDIANKMFISTKKSMENKLENKMPGTLVNLISYKGADSIPLESRSAWHKHFTKMLKTHIGNPAEYLQKYDGDNDNYNTIIVRQNKIRNAITAIKAAGVSEEELDVATKALGKENTPIYKIYKLHSKISNGEIVDDKIKKDIIEAINDYYSGVDNINSRFQLINTDVLISTIGLPSEVRTELSDKLKISVLDTTSATPAVLNDLFNNHYSKMLPDMSDENVEEFIRIIKENGITEMFTAENYKTIRRNKPTYGEPDKESFTSTISVILQQAIASGDKDLEDFISANLENLPGTVMNRVRNNLLGLGRIVSEVSEGEISPQQNIGAKEVRKMLQMNDINFDQLVRGSIPRKKKGEDWVSYMKRSIELNNDQEGNAIDELKVELEPDADGKKISKELVTKYYAGKHGNVYPRVTKSFKANLVFPEFDTFFEENPGDGKMFPVYHGTGGVAATMILRYGFKVIKATDASVVGRMLGDGIYFSNKIDKTLQYVSNSGYSRSATTGYLFEMEANLGKYDRSESNGPDYRAAGIKGDNIRSPEWCVRDPKKQLAIRRVYEVDLVRNNEYDKYVEGVTLNESGKMKSYDQFLKEEIMKTNVNTAEYRFRDGMIPVKIKGIMKYVDFEEAIERKLIKESMIDYSSQGPIVIFTNTDKQIFEDYRHVGVLRSGNLDRYFKYYDAEMKKRG